MKTISEIRLENAKLLVLEAKSRAAFARSLGMSDSQIWQLMGANKRRNIGNQIARRMEEVGGRPSGWLDTDHSTESANQTNQAKGIGGDAGEANLELSPKAIKVGQGFDRLNGAQQQAVLAVLAGFKKD